MSPSEHLELSSASDAALVVAIARYREDALAEVYRRHGGAVYNLARRVLASEQLAEEVTQEVFLRLWNQPERFEPDRGALRSYLLAQTHGRAVDMVRSESARRRREERDADLDPAPVTIDVEREAWGVIVAERVRDAVQELPDAERQALELAYFGGHSYREVAEMLGTPEGTVKSRIRTALGRLRGTLAAAGVGGLS